MRDRDMQLVICAVCSTECEENEAAYDEDLAGYICFGCLALLNCEIDYEGLEDETIEDDKDRPPWGECEHCGKLTELEWCGAAGGAFLCAACVAEVQ